MKMKVVLLIGCAGFLGTLVRFGCIKLVGLFAPQFPIGTLFVNILGAFIAGVCFIICREKFQGYEAYFPILFIGFLGAFTTFSTFALESAHFFTHARYLHFIANVGLQMVTGLVAAVSGLWVGSWFCR